MAFFRDDATMQTASLSCRLMQFDTFVYPEHLDPRWVHSLQSEVHYRKKSCKPCWHGFVSVSKPWPLFPSSQCDLNQLGRPPNDLACIASPFAIVMNTHSKNSPTSGLWIAGLGTRYPDHLLGPESLEAFAEQIYGFENAG